MRTAALKSCCGGRASITGWSGGNFVEKELSYGNSQKVLILPACQPIPAGECSKSRLLPKRADWLSPTIRRR